MRAAVYTDGSSKHARVGADGQAHTQRRPATPKQPCLPDHDVLPQQLQNHCREAEHKPTHVGILISPAPKDQNAVSDNNQRCRQRAVQGSNHIILQCDRHGTPHIVTIVCSVAAVVSKGFMQPSTIAWWSELRACAAAHLLPATPSRAMEVAARRPAPSVSAGKQPQQPKLAAADSAQQQLHVLQRRQVG